MLFFPFLIPSWSDLLELEGGGYPGFYQCSNHDRNINNININNEVPPDTIVIRWVRGASQ